MPGRVIPFLLLLAGSPIVPADDRRPSALEVTGVPDITSELTERLRQYQQIRQARFGGWAPSGKGILIHTRFGNTTQLHRVYDPGGRREQITFYEEPVHGRFIRDSSTDSLLLEMGEGGNENFQTYLLDRMTGRTRMLTDGQSRFLLGPVFSDGKRAMLTGNPRNGRDMDLFVADLTKETPLLPLLETHGEFWSAADVTRDGKMAILNRYVSANESYPFLFDIENKRKMPITIEKEASSSTAVRFSADEKAVFVISDANGEFKQLYRYDIASKSLQNLSQEISWNVEAVDVSENGDIVAFTTNEEGSSKIHVWNGSHREEFSTPRGVIGDLEFSPDGTTLGFTLSRADAPSDAYSVNLAGAPELTRWTYSEVGGLPPDQFTVPDLIKFPSFDERLIPAFIYRPKEATEKCPVLILVHGGPESQYTPIFSGFVQYLVQEMGVAVIAPNVRGSAGYGKSYLLLDNAEKREDSVKDIGSLLDWISTSQSLDPSRVAIMGGSYGGYMVLGSLTHYPGRIRAGVDIVGIANFITFLETTSAYRQDLRRAEYGNERDPMMREILTRISPTTNAKRIDSSLLVIHGKNDPRVPFHEAEQIAKVVQERGKPVWTIYADNEGHGFARKENRDFMDAAIAVFLEHHLLR